LHTGTVWADDRHFSFETGDWPDGENLRDLTKQHWDENLNSQYTCPTLYDGYKSQLIGEDTSKQKCRKAFPQGTNCVHWETGSFFLFQDVAIQGAEVYHNTGSVVTLNAIGQAKEFTVMSGNMNEKVQMLQVGFSDILVDLSNCVRTHILIVPSGASCVCSIAYGQWTWCFCCAIIYCPTVNGSPLGIRCDPLDSEQPIEYLSPVGNDLWGPDGTVGPSTIKVFWLARDRIFPSEW
jgi:hypothetical protein